MHAFLFKKQWEAVLLGAAGSTAGQGLQGPPRNQAQGQDSSSFSSHSSFSLKFLPQSEDCFSKAMWQNASKGRRVRAQGSAYQAFLFMSFPSSRQSAFITAQKCLM